MDSSKYYIAIGSLEPENKKMSNSLELVNEIPSDDEIHFKELCDTINIYIHKVTYFTSISLLKKTTTYFYSFKHPNEEEYKEEDGFINVNVKMAGMFELDKSYFDQMLWQNQKGRITFDTLKKDLF